MSAHRDARLVLSWRNAVSAVIPIYVYAGNPNQRLSAEVPCESVDASLCRNGFWCGWPTRIRLKGLVFLVDVFANDSARQVQNFKGHFVGVCLFLQVIIEDYAVHGIAPQTRNVTEIFGNSHRRQPVGRLGHEELD